MRDFFIKFRKSESGATLVEYGVALILAVVVGGLAITELGQSVTDQMDESEDLMDGDTAAVGNGDNS